MKDNENGFTIVELMLYIVISSIILLSIYSFINSGFLNYQLGSNKIKIQRDIYLSEEIIKNALRDVTKLKIDTFGECDSCTDKLKFIKENDNFYLSLNGSKKTNNIFSNIEIEILKKNILKFKFDINNYDNYEMNLLLNNFEFESGVGSSIETSSGNLEILYD